MSLPVDQPNSWHTERDRFALSRVSRSRTIELVLPGTDVPWAATQQFLLDVYTVMREYWIDQMEDIEDYVFVLEGVTPGSQHFHGRLRKRGKRQQGTVRTNREPAEFQSKQPKGSQTISKDAKFGAGAVLIAAVLTPTVGALVSPPQSLPSGPPPVVQQACFQRIEVYVRDHAGHVWLIVTEADGKRFEILLGTPGDRAR
jgi:hypothetical protein